MTDHQAFLNAVIDRPDDDLLRLVYADFLEENGDPDRAEFVRLQVEHAAADPTAGGWVEREARLRQLLRDHDWRIPNLKGKQDFRRGLVEAVSTTAERLLALPASLFDSAPVRDLRVWNAADFIEPLTRLPWLPRAEVLDLRNSHLGTGNRLLRLLNDAYLPRLHALNLQNNILWADELRYLFSLDVCGQLVSLDLSGNPFSDAGATELRYAVLPRLETLALRTDDLPFTDCLHGDGAFELAQAHGFPSLRRLDLRGHHVGDSGFIELLRSPLMAKLEVLDVGFNDLGATGDAAFDALVSAPGLDALRVLRLNGSTVDRRAADALAGWPHLETMREVNLRRCAFGSGAVARLEQSRWAAKFVLE